MTTITYTVAGTNTTADGASVTFDIIPNRSVEPISLTPVTGFARAGTVIQQTTVEIESRVTIAQDAIPEFDLPEWERFFISQMYSNDPFELDAVDVPGIRKIMQCKLEPQDYSPSTFACTHYSTSFTALVISTTDFDQLLTTGTTDTAIYGNRAGGEDITTGLITFGFASTGVALEVVMTGYDVDNVDEVEVSVNGTSIGTFQNVANNAFGAPETFQIPASLQNTGTNTLTVRQLIDASFSWGVKDILIRNA